MAMVARMGNDMLNTTSDGEVIYNTLHYDGVPYIMIGRDGKNITLKVQQLRELYVRTRDMRTVPLDMTNKDRPHPRLF